MRGSRNASSHAVSPTRVATQIASSCQTNHRGATWGPPSGRTVATWQRRHVAEHAPDDRRRPRSQRPHELGQLIERGGRLRRQGLPQRRPGRRHQRGRVLARRAGRGVAVGQIVQQLERRARAAARSRRSASSTRGDPPASAAPTSSGPFDRVGASFEIRDRVRRDLGGATDRGRRRARAPAASVWNRAAAAACRSAGNPARREQLVGERGRQVAGDDRDPGADPLGVGPAPGASPRRSAGRAPSAPRGAASSSSITSSWISAIVCRSSSAAAARQIAGTSAPPAARYPQHAERRPDPLPARAHEPLDLLDRLGRRAARSRRPRRGAPSRKPSRTSSTRDATPVERGHGGGGGRSHRRPVSQAGGSARQTAYHGAPKPHEAHRSAPSQRPPSSSSCS